MFIEIRLWNRMTYAFKDHVKIVQIYMSKFNVSILNSLKKMFVFLNTKYVHQYKLNVSLNKTVTKCTTILTKCSLNKTVTKLSTILTKCFFCMSEPYKLTLYCSQSKHFNIARSVSQQPS